MHGGPLPSEHHGSKGTWTATKREWRFLCGGQVIFFVFFFSAADIRVSSSVPFSHILPVLVVVWGCLFQRCRRTPTLVTATRRCAHPRPCSIRADVQPHLSLVLCSCCHFLTLDKRFPRRACMPSPTLTALTRHTLSASKLSQQGASFVCPSRAEQKVDVATQ